MESKNKTPFNIKINCDHEQFSAADEEEAATKVGILTRALTFLGGGIT